MTTGVRRLSSDEYNEATKEMFECLKTASKFPIGHQRRIYWEQKADEAKKLRQELKALGLHRYTQKGKRK